MMWLAVALGGALGAVGRYALAQLLPFADGKWPVATLIANVAGSFLMGVCFVLIAEKAVLPQYTRQFIMVGVLGAFTTFSTFSLEAIQLLYADYIRTAMLYVFASVCASITAVFLGYSLTHKLV